MGVWYFGHPSPPPGSESAESFRLGALDPGWVPARSPSSLPLPHPGPALTLARTIPAIKAAQRARARVSGVFFLLAWFCHLCLSAGEYVGRAASAGEAPRIPHVAFYSFSHYPRPPAPGLNGGCCDCGGVRERPAAQEWSGGLRTFAGTHLWVLGVGRTPRLTQARVSSLPPGQRALIDLQGRAGGGVPSVRAVREASGMDSETDLRSPLFHVVGVKKSCPRPGPFLAVKLRVLRFPSPPLFFHLQNGDCGDPRCLGEGVCFRLELSEVLGGSDGGRGGRVL